jgi:hypothetical protein
MVFPACFGFYPGNFVLSSKFALVILGGTKRGKIEYSFSFFISLKNLTLIKNIYLIDLTLARAQNPTA